MIVKRIWRRRSPAGSQEWMLEGWFLFGLLPLYIRDLEPRFSRTR
jgi:hypothetical protein